MQSNRLPPPRKPRNIQIPLAALAAMVTSGCGTFLDDTGSADTDAPAPYEGVYIGCQNLPADGGADETGGGGAPVGDNYWWAPYNGPPLLSWQECGPGVTDEICCVEGLLDTLNCFEKEYAEPGSGLYGGGIGPFCLTPSFDGGVDPLADWINGEYPTVDAALRAECTAQCENKPSPSGVPYNCQDADWVAARTYNGWDPSDGYNCMGAADLNVDDPDGSGIDWSVAGGLSTQQPLECDLDEDCSDWFIPNTRSFVLTPGEATLIEPETRGAQFLGVEGNGSELQIDMPGVGVGVDDTENLYGQAEYSAVDCGHDVCPFYLANLSAFNTTDSWDIDIAISSSSSLPKSISNVQIDLLQSTLGVHNLALGKVAFAPGALRLQVQLTVDSCSNCGSFGNGTHVAVVENQDVVFADYDDGDLDIRHSFPLQLGSATLEITVEAVERPPVAAHDISSTEVCNDPDGLRLRPSRSLSTDPDDDIVFERWLVDGAPCGSECVVPLGAHEVVLEATDSRGAIDQSEGHWVLVGPGSACGS